MCAWNMPAQTNTRFCEFFKLRNKIDSIKVFDRKIYWKYASLLDLCGSNSSFSQDDHVKNLEMMEGEFFDKDTLDLIERPLMSKIAALQNKMMRKALTEYETLVLEMIQRMKMDRRDDNNTDPPRIPKRSEAMRKRYGK
jgi:hypothetical protein